MRTLFITALCLAAAHGFTSDFSMQKQLQGVVSIQGERHNGNNLYVTAGEKIYSIGNQRGEFPAVGFHIPGEMGGIWMHPIKLMDGFSFVSDGHPLDVADRFTTYPYATQFAYHHDGFTFTRTDFAVDALPVVVSELTVENHTGKSRTIQLRTLLQSHLSPTWLSKRDGVNDGADRPVSFDNGRLLIKDALNNWFSGALVTGVKQMRLQQTDKGLKTIYTLQGKVMVAAHSSRVVRLFVSGSQVSAQATVAQLDKAQSRLPDLFAQKQQRYQTIDATAQVSIPDKRLQQAYQWGKYATDWLTRNVPGMGRGLSAGLPDYPWFFSNDQSATFTAIVGTHEPELMYESIDMLMQHSNAFNHNSGRIIHEMSSNGQVYDKGRMEESQEFIHAAWTVYQWTGNRKLLDAIYDQALKVNDFLMANDRDHDLFVEGYGGVEIEGLNDEMVDVACHTAEFFKDMHDMSLEMNQPERAQSFSLKADTLIRRINQYWWCEAENRYYDMLTDSATALRLIDKALKEWVSDDRNRWAKQKLTALKDSIKTGRYNENGYNIFYNPSTIALTTGVADTLKARSYLQHVPYFCNKFGLYISGISRPDDITMEESSVASRLKGDFNYKQAIMVGATSNLAIAECLYNNADSALFYIDKILNNFSFATPGTTYEVCPDYGMFVQAWNVSGINIPLIQHFFGIAPMASHRHIDFHPAMPTAWPEAHISNVPVGDNKVSMDYVKSAGSITYTMTSEQADWNYTFHLPQGATHVVVNGQAVNGAPEILQLSGKENRIVYQR